jgi:hypothetical protein
MDQELSTSAERSPLHSRLLELGSRLQSCLQAVVNSLPQEAQRTAGMARHTQANKVFTSRLLKALRQEDGLNVVHHLPGPDPLLKFLDDDGMKEVPERLLIHARDAVRSFQTLIEEEAGNRTSLQTMMSSWLVDTRGEFEQRRRQAAFKAVSELKGSAVDLNLSVAILNPSENPRMMDLVWLMGMIGLQRLRPDAQIRLDTRRISDEGNERHPTTLAGAPLDGMLPAGFEDFCPNGPAPLEAQQVGGTMNYMLAGSQFGPRQRSDMLLIEVNRDELRRIREDDPTRKSYLYANPVPPTQQLVLDVWLHKSLLGAEPPELLIYDTAGSGPKDPNESISHFDLLEVAEELEYHDGNDGVPDIPQYSKYEKLMGEVMDQLEWAIEDFHLWRVNCPYPLHSSQVTIAFRPRV